MDCLKEIIQENGIINYINNYKQKRTYKQIMDQILENLDFKETEHKEYEGLLYEDMEISDKRNYFDFSIISGKNDVLERLLDIISYWTQGHTFSFSKNHNFYNVAKKYEHSIKKIIKIEDNPVGKLSNEGNDIFEKYVDFFHQILKRIDVTMEEYFMIYFELYKR